MLKHTKPDSTTYLLRDVPKDVWLRARAKATLEGRSIREAIIGLLDDWSAITDGRFVEKPAKRAGVRRTAK